MENVQNFPIVVSDLFPVGREVIEHFRKQGYEVDGHQTPTAGWKISISKGDTFKAVMGLRTALNLEIEPIRGGTEVKVQVGWFSLQAIPSALTYFVFPPLLIGQIWGLVKQTDLDREAMERVHQALLRHGRSPSPGASAPGQPFTGTARPMPGASSGSSAPSGSPTGPAPTSGFCPSCGARILPPGKFCSGCGTKLG